MPASAKARAVFDSVTNAITSERLSLIILYIVVGVWIAYRLLMRSLLGSFFADSPPSEDKIMRLIMIVTVAFTELSRIWRGEYGKKDAIAIVIFAAMAWGFHLTGRIDYMFDTVAVFAMRNEGFRRLTWFCVVLVSLCTVAIVGAALSGMTTDIVSGSGTERVRHFIGFTYSLFGPQVLFTLTCSICWLRDKDMHWLGIAVLVALNIAFFIYTNSRLSFGLSLTVLAVTVLRKVLKSNGAWKRFGQVASWGFVVTALVSIAIVAVYAEQLARGQHWLDGLNDLFGGRIQLTHDALATMGCELFGQSVRWVGAGLNVYGQRGDGAYNYVDNLYFHSLIERGIVYTVGLIVLYTLAALKAVREGDYMLSIVLGVLSIHFLIDDLALQLCFNTLLFVCGSYLAAGAGKRLAARLT